MSNEHLYNWTIKIPFKEYNMRHIGKIIEEYRNDLKMSRSALALNICSEKYIYLIEKGERTPSSIMLKQLSQRLGVDLFEYYKYLDCIDPIKVRDYMMVFHNYRVKNYNEELKKETEAAMKLPDFKNKPWCYEIQLNIIIYNIFFKKEIEQSILEINEMLQKIEPKYSDEEFVVSLYVLLSTCYQIINNVEEARKNILIAHDLIQNKISIRYFRDTVINVRLNILTFYYRFGEYDKAIDRGRELVKYHYKSNSFEKLLNSCFFLAFSCYKSKLYDEAIEMYKTGIHAAMVDYRPQDIYYISLQDVFYDMLEEKAIGRDLVNDFKKKYSNIIN